MERKVIGLLRKYTQHKRIRLAQRGNKAIAAALKYAKKANPKEYVLVPEQGGWLTFLNYPKKEGFDIKTVKTDYGIIDLKDLKSKVKNASAIIYTNPAGYFAEQPLKEIYEICKNKCLVILDVSGSVGDTLCNGKYTDIMLGSFGKWKPVNIEYGGFISFKKKKDYEQSKKILSELDFDKSKLSELYEKLKGIKKKYSLFYKTNKKIKKDLKDFRIIHKDKKGINAIVVFHNDNEKEKLINYCKTKGYEFTLCPRYIRVNEYAVSIEVKRINSD